MSTTRTAAAPTGPTGASATGGATGGGAPGSVPDGTGALPVAGRPPRPPLLRVPGTLFAKYALAFCGLVSAAVLASGGYWGWTVARAQRVSLEQLHGERTGAAAETIKEYARELELALTFVAQNRSSGPGYLEDRADEYVRLLRVGSFVELRDLDPHGRERLHAHLPLGSLVRESGRSFAETEAYRIGQRATFVGPLLRRPANPLMTVAVPLGAAGAPGVLIGEANARGVTAAMERALPRGGAVYLADRSGRIVAHSDPAVAAGTDFAHLPHVREALPIAALQRAREGPVVAESTGAAGRRVLVGHAAVVRPDWLLFTEEPLDHALAPFYAALGQTAGLLAAALVAALAAGLFFARSFVRPILALRAGAEALGAGQFERRVTIRSGDELEGLAESFNRMAAQLRDYYATLEQRVDLARAREIQDRLLPKTLPTWPAGLELGWRFRAAREMSGDFYDVLPLVPADGDPRALPERPPLLLAVGDVQGKGIAAALVMALARATLRAVAESALGEQVSHGPEPERDVPSPAQLLRRTGGLLHRGAGRRDFVACALGVVEPPSHDRPAVRLRVANAAQVPVLLCRQDRVQELEPPGERLPLAILSQPDYGELAIQLHPGDAVVFSSDGLVEAPAQAGAAAGDHLPPPAKTGQLFGFERLQRSAAHWSRKAGSAEAVAEGIWGDLTAWCGEESHHDDVTLLVLRVPATTERMETR